MTAAHAHDRTLIPGDGIAGRIASLLEASRHRMLNLLDRLDEGAQTAQHSTLMSPLVWDLAHVGNYEELWLLSKVTGEPTSSPRLDDLYNAFEHPRWERPSLPILDPGEARAYVGNVRERALETLARVDVGAEVTDPLLAEGFVYGMVVQHEQQHIETVLATLQLMGDDSPVTTRDGRPALAGGYLPRGPLEPTTGSGSAKVNDRPAPSRANDMVCVPAGPFLMGSDSEPWAYDNERSAHVVELPTFRIDRAPVSNERYMEFLEDDGYGRPQLWNEVGWQWRLEAGLRAPRFWRRVDGAWLVNRQGWVVPLRPDEPVQHVCWYEADAFARWEGKRLPTELEWEKAASWTPDGRKLRWPWGDEDLLPPAAEARRAGGPRATLAGPYFGPAPVGSRPAGRSPWGCHQMVGDTWEWTSSDFRPYPGFRAFPYREYSEVFFGDEYKVLRGGSWATHPMAMRTTFRNWDFPIRRQIFAGFRCAADA